MNTKTKTTVLLALGAGMTLFTFFRFQYPLVPADMLVADLADSSSIEDYYGFDRLEDDELVDELWLPEISVAGDADFARAGHMLDTISLSEWTYYANHLVLLSNPGHLLPLHPSYDLELIRPEANAFAVLSNGLNQMTNFRESTFSNDLPEVSINCSRDVPVVLLLDEENANIVDRTSATLLDFSNDKSLVIIYFGDHLPDGLNDFPAPVLHLSDASSTAQAIAVQVLFGALDTPLANGDLMRAIRLGHAPPELMGIDREKLKSIDSYVNSAIRRRAIPGCQVLVAKSGKIVYEKTFGYHTYAKDQVVDPLDLYDIASITKAAATTLGLMKLTDEAQFDLANRISDYLPQYNKSGLKYLRMRHLLSHQTGLQANLPIAQFLRQDDIFQDQKNKSYLTALGKDMFLRNDVKETLLNQLKSVKVPRRSFYRYSDVNFILLQQVLEQQSGLTMDAYLERNFYEPLGLRRLQFLPGLSLPDEEIVPTEKDNRWRHELVRGEVHDESALLMGGVAGHAGLFSNARDLAVVFQMLLNGGTYGDETFLSESTIRTFTHRNNYNYRAFGFDRLAGHSKSLRYYGASEQTYGHTGFTGTCVWADPENDLIFIFLSNRIHPDKYNNKLQKLGLRERIHKIVYQSLGTAKQEV
jgi:CubicO group peptidase (beta-lactamase class C family)